MAALKDRPVSRWKTREGKLISISDMSDSHLVNAINFVLRNEEKIRLNLAIHRSRGMVLIHGEMAQLAAEDEIAQLAVAPLSEVYPLYGDLCDEANRRGLSL